MSRAPLWRALAAFAVIATSLFLAFTTAPRLGLDLRGGTQIVLETKDSPTVKADAESTDRALEVLRRRVDALGVVDPTLARSGEKRIIVELPGVQDPRRRPRSSATPPSSPSTPVRGAWPSRATRRRCPTRAGSRSKLDPARDQRRRRHRRRRRRSTRSAVPAGGSASTSATRPPGRS